MEKKLYSVIEPFSAHIITDDKKMDFSKREYSWFKYGSKTVARKFGYELASEFFKSKQFLELVINHKEKQIVVCSSPYQFIPTATFAMKDYFIQKLNEKLVELGIDPVEECKISRICCYDTDYGTMSAEERTLKISGDEFHIDKDAVKDKFVIFLDDIKITGAHERRVQQLIDNYNLECDYMFMCYAESHIVDNPQIEDFLNLYAVKTLLDINYIIRNQEFILNTRVTKFILQAPKEEFENFVNYQSESFRETLYRNAIGNKYHKSDKFAENIKYLQKNI